MDSIRAFAVACGQTTPKKNTMALQTKLYRILSDPRWYSYSVCAIMRKCGMASVDELKDVARRLAQELQDPINFFWYNDIEYAGFESRRLDYERDKRAGTNHIEKLIAQGAYKGSCRPL
jgi:hypothetical protein